MPKSDSQIVEEPFLLLGYGVNAFFEIQYSLAFMCLAITAFLLPAYIIYSQSVQAGALELESIPWKYGLNQFTLGNLGGATT